MRTSLFLLALLVLSVAHATSVPQGTALPVPDLDSAESSSTEAVSGESVLSHAKEAHRNRETADGGKRDDFA